MNKIYRIILIMVGIFLIYASYSLLTDVLRGFNWVGVGIFIAGVGMVEGILCILAGILDV